MCVCVPCCFAVLLLQVCRNARFVGGLSFQVMAKKTQSQQKAASKAPSPSDANIPLAEQQDSKVFAAQTKEAKTNQKIKALVMKSLRDTFKDMLEAEIYHIYDTETGTHTHTHTHTHSLAEDRYPR